jgi:hypothetical protein
MAEQQNPGIPGERIGRGLVRVGALNEQQVAEILIQQRTESGVDRLFGEIAVELGFCDDATITSLLASDSATTPP